MTDPSKNGKKSAPKRFEPGNPGGPGRPEGSRNKATLLLDKMAGDEAQAIMKHVIAEANDGKVWAIELVLSRVWPARKSRAVSIELPDIETAADALTAQAAVVRAAAGGELALDEAQALSTLIEGQRRVIETVDLEARIRRLEEVGAPKP